MKRNFKKLVSLPLHFKHLLGLIFLLHHTMADVPDCGNTELTKSYGTIKSPGYPLQSYQANIDCLWHIAPNTSVTSSTDSPPASTENLATSTRAPTSSRGLTLYIRQFLTLTSDSPDSSDRLLIYRSNPANVSTQTAPVQTYSGKVNEGEVFTCQCSELWLRFLSGSSHPPPQGPEIYGFDLVFVSQQQDDIFCPTPMTPMNDQTQPLGNYTLGSVVYFTCNSGYRLDGQDSSKCVLRLDSSGVVRTQWDQHIPQCLNTCPSPSRVNNGKFIINSAEVNGTVTYSCDEPFLLYDPAERSFTLEEKNLTCIVKDDGIPSWEGPSPSCRVSDCSSVLTLNRPSWIIVNPSYPRSFVAGGHKVCQWVVSVAQGRGISFNISYVDIPARADFKLIDVSTNIALLHIADDQPAQSYPLNIVSYGSKVRVVYLGPQQDSTANRGFFVTYTTVDSPAVPPSLPSTTTPRTRPTTPFILPTTQHIGVSQTVAQLTSNHEDDNSAAKIAAGVTVPLVLLALIAVGIGYWLYRKKYPVRMIPGRDFGKFSNPQYQPPRRTHTLVREDAEDFFHRETQPGSRPDLSLIISGDKREGSAYYENTAFEFDSGEADEEEVERRFRERKSYLFKKAEDSVDGGGSEDGESSPSKKGKRAKAEDDSRDEKGEDNAGYVADVHEAEDGGSQKPLPRNKSASSTEGLSTDTDADRTSDSDVDTKPAPKPRARKKRRLPPTAPPPEPQEEESQAAVDTTAEYHAGMTVREFLQMVQSKQKRALSDTPKEGANSLGHDNERPSARRRSQSMDTGLVSVAPELTEKVGPNVAVNRTASDAARYERKGADRAVHESAAREVNAQQPPTEEPPSETRDQETRLDDGFAPGDKHVSEASLPHLEDESNSSSRKAAAGDEAGEDDKASDIESVSDEESPSEDYENYPAIQQAQRGRGEGSMSNLLTNDESPRQGADSEAAVSELAREETPEKTVAFTIGEASIQEGGFRGTEDENHDLDESKVQDDEKRASSSDETSTDDDDREYVNVQAFQVTGSIPGFHSYLDAGGTVVAEQEEAQGAPERPASTEEDSFVVLSRNGDTFDQSDSASSASDFLPPPPPLPETPPPPESPPPFPEPPRGLSQTPPSFPDIPPPPPEIPLPSGSSDENSIPENPVVASKPSVMASPEDAEPDNLSTKTNSSFSSIHSGKIDEDDASLSPETSSFTSPLSEIAMGNQGAGVRSVPQDIPPRHEDVSSESDTDSGSPGTTTTWSPADAERDEHARKVQVVPRLPLSDVSSEYSSKGSQTESDDDSIGRDVVESGTAAGERNSLQFQFDTDPVRSRQSTPSPTELGARQDPGRALVRFTNPSMSTDNDDPPPRPVRGLAALKKLSVSLDKQEEPDSDEDVQLTDDDIEEALASDDDSDDDRGEVLVVGQSSQAQAETKPVTMKPDPKTTLVFSEESEEDIDV